MIGKAGSHYVILLYCKTLLQVLLGIYCKRFYWIPLFAILLLFQVFEVGKAKSATQSVLMIFTLNGYSRKIFRFFTLPLQIPYPQLNLPHAPPLFVFFHYSFCTVISDCNHPFDTSTFTHTVSQEYIIAIENTYLNRVF